MLILTDVHLSKINHNNFQSSYFSEYSHLLSPEAAAQKFSVKMFFYRKSLVLETYCSKVTGLN